MTTPPLRHDALDPAEVEQMRTRWGAFPVQEVTLQVAPPFLNGKHQMLTGPGRRAEICYVLYGADPLDGVLLHIKRFYPSRAYRLPTGGIPQGEGVEATLAREIWEETGLKVGESGSGGVMVERCLGVIHYALDHSTLGRQQFATYHFLVRQRDNAPLSPQDPSEQIAGWRWVPTTQLREVADLLDAVGARPGVEGREWADWGRFRAISHRFVAAAMHAAAV